jgi:hypothetical protein
MDKLFEVFHSNDGHLQAKNVAETVSTYDCIVPVHPTAAIGVEAAKSDIGVRGPNPMGSADLTDSLSS